MAFPYYEIKVRDTEGKVSSIFAKHATSVDQLRQIVMRAQKDGQMPVGEIISIEKTSNPKIPTATVKVAAQDAKGNITEKEVRAAQILGVGSKPTA